MISRYSLTWLSLWAAAAIIVLIMVAPLAFAGGAYVTKHTTVVVEYYEYVEIPGLPRAEIRPYTWFGDRPVYAYDLNSKREACRAPAGTPCNSAPADPQPLWAGRPVRAVVVIDKSDCIDDTAVCGIVCAGYAYCSEVQD